MKTILQIISLFLLGLSLFGQDCYTEATQENIKSDYSQLCLGRTYQGTIGNDNQRIEVRFIEIAKDSVSHSKYHVKGKSKVKNNVCDFQGIMTVDKIMILDEMDMACEEPDLSAGILYGSYEFLENPDQNHVGRFTGTFKIMFDQSPDGYVVNMGGAGQEGFNSFMGVWEDYNKTGSRFCCWGLQIPPSKNDALFKHYDNELYLFNSNYFNKGWRSYVLSNLNSFIKVPVNYETNVSRGETDFMIFTKDEINEAIKNEAVLWWQ